MRVDSGSRRSHHIASTPTAGPIASSPNATPHDVRVPGSRKPTPTIVTPVSHAPGGWSAEFADADGHVLSMYQTEDVPRSKTAIR